MLRQALLKRPEVFLSTFTEKLLTYAVGRSVDYRDQPTIREHRSGGRPQATIVFPLARPGAGADPPFQMRYEADGVKLMIISKSLTAPPDVSARA